MDSPDYLLLLLAYPFLVFLFYTFSVGSVRLIWLTHVGFRAHVQIAYRIVTCLFTKQTKHVKWLRYDTIRDGILIIISLNVSSRRTMGVNSLPKTTSRLGCEPRPFCAGVQHHRRRLSVWGTGAKFSWTVDCNFVSLYCSSRSIEKILVNVLGYIVWRTVTV